jgi:hypothetical protein
MNHLFQSFVPVQTIGGDRLDPESAQDFLDDMKSSLVSVTGSEINSPFSYPKRKKSDGAISWPKGRDTESLRRSSFILAKFHLTCPTRNESPVHASLLTFQACRDAPHSKACQKPEESRQIVKEESKELCSNIRSAEQEQEMGEIQGALFGSSDFLTAFKMRTILKSPSSVHLKTFRLRSSPN